VERVTSSLSTERRPVVAIDLRLADYRAGGIARYARELSAALARLEEVRIVPLWSHRDGRQRGGISLRTPPHFRLEERVVPLELLLRRVRCDVFHAPDFLAPRLRRVPVVATVHDLAFEAWPHDLDPSALAYYRRLRQTRQWTTAWITPSEWSARELTARYDVDPATIHVIHHGESLGLLQEPVVPRHERGNFVLAVGTVEPRKRYNVLLDAQQHHPHNPALVIVGQRGWQVSAVEQRLRRTAGVTWLQAVGDDQLRALYRTALAVVIPSRAEGFGLPALEAMAAGTPVLSSGGGALREVTGAAADLVLDDSGQAWAAAIARIAGDTARWDQLAAAGRARAAQFSWERAARETASVYRAVAGY
jgi:glycosyltransferase involved in cell wall biosynthesis